MKGMGMIRCEHVLAKLWEFLDGELTPQDELAVKKHLDVCNLCYPRYNFQRAYFEYTHRLRDHEHVSSALRRRVFQGILEQEANDRKGA